jgi:hypothetical protein
MTVSMNSIPFRRLQRMTVKDLNEQIPCYVTVRGTPQYELKSADSQPPENIKKQKAVSFTVKAEKSYYDSEDKIYPVPKPKK